MKRDIIKFEYLSDSKLLKIRREWTPSYRENDRVNTDKLVSIGEYEILQPDHKRINADETMADKGWGELVLKKVRETSPDHVRTMSYPGYEIEHRTEMVRFVGSDKDEPHTSGYFVPKTIRLDATLPETIRLEYALPNFENGNTPGQGLLDLVLKHRSDVPSKADFGFDESWMSTYPEP